MLVYAWLAVAPLLFAGPVSADPFILPPNNPLTAPPAVFCFGVTGGDALTGGGVRIQFQVLNWTGETASQLKITQAFVLPFAPPTVNTGGLFANGIGSPASPDPINGWSPVYSGLPTDSVGVTFTANTGNELQGIDLDPNNDLDFIDAPALPSPLDSGINALDGFFLDFPYLDVGERVVLQWDLLNNLGNNVDGSGPGGNNPFSFGLFQIDRGSDGSIRIATAYSIGNDLSDITATPAPVDLAITDLNAMTLSPTALSAVPVPGALWLMLSGLAGLLGFTTSRRQTDQS